jgi:hypothetical protein
MAKQSRFLSGPEAPIRDDKGFSIEATGLRSVDGVSLERHPEVSRFDGAVFRLLN